MKYTNRADLLIAAGESIKMQEKLAIEPMQKYNGSIMPITVDGKFFFGDNIEKNEFPIAVVEGKAVFVGDELYWIRDGRKTIVVEGWSKHSDWDKLSWNQPKPKTVMIKLLREDAEFIIRVYGDCSTGSHAGNCAQACRKALEEK